MVSLGVCILRRAGTLVAIECDQSRRRIVFERRLPRLPGTSAAEFLRELRRDIPMSAVGSPMAIVLSPVDLACSDSWVIPEALLRKSSDRFSAALCETRCATESLESLAHDVQVCNGAAFGAALDRAQTDELMLAAADFKVVLLAPAPAVLAQAFGSLTLQQGGERFEIRAEGATQAWRAYPVDRCDDDTPLAWHDLDVPGALAPAFAAAVCDPDSVPNLLNALPQYRKTFAKRFRDILVNLAAAAALCFGACGVHFHREAAREHEETADARRAEMDLWSRFLPAQEPREGKLLKTMRERLDDLGETSGSTEFPSALSFWGEIGKQMPDPEALGLTLESLDLAPDGGRISARVPVVKDDPLKNAGQLEAKLSQSPKMTARGDYEVRDGQVQVRLRMDYKP